MFSPAPLSSPQSLLRSHYFFIAVGAHLLAVVLYVGLSSLIAGTVAFPLDDAWIHQTYAHTIAQSGEWAYRVGAPSSGSTAPLWTLLLAVGQFLRLPPTLWAYVCGVLASIGLIATGGLLSLRLFESRRVAEWTMIALAVEWHLAWASVSGMEITLYIALTLLLFWMFAENKGTLWLWGIVGGLLTLTRPEGALVLGLVGLGWGWQQRQDSGKLVRGWIQLAVGWALCVLPYLVFNWSVSGLLFPNTFYAKQQEYASLLAKPIWTRLLDILVQPSLGGQTLLLFVLPFLPWRTFRLSQWLPLIWAIAIVLLYALRLPVTYQHGRYLIPIIPVLVIYGVAGLGYLSRRLPRLFVRPLSAGVIVAFGLFIYLGADSYATDVSIIECDMGGAATWLAANVAPTDLLAIHDIGKVGYNTPNPLLDFAGLITPDTIPLIRDESGLLDLAVARDAKYLVTYADWYPQMVQDPRLVERFATNCPATLAAGQTPMTIYEISP